MLTLVVQGGYAGGRGPLPHEDMADDVRKRLLLKGPGRLAVSSHGGYLTLSIEVGERALGAVLGEEEAAALGNALLIGARKLGELSSSSARVG